MKTVITLTFLSIFGFTYAQIPSYVPSNGLVGWWPFNGNANDESGNGNDGTVNGATLTADRFGNPNAAFSFNGIDNLITVSAQTDVTQNSNYTVSFWYNSPTSDYNGAFLSFGSWFCKLGHDSPGLFYKDEIGNQANNWYVQQHFNYLPQVNTWNQLVIRKIGTTINLYNNQILVGTITSYGFANFNATSLIQFGYYCCQEYFNGQLDDIGIWNRDLTESEIQSLFQGCQLATTTQPTSQSINLSNGSATFHVSSNAVNPTYQWQSNLGLGFQNLSNAGQYSGTTTSDLTVSNISLANDNQLFRCVISESSCVDTSDVATLTIIDDASLLSQNEVSLMITPNPINDAFSISGMNQLHFIYIYDINGKILKSFDVNEKTHSLSAFKSGVYFIEVNSDSRTKVVKVIKN